VTSDTVHTAPTHHFDVGFHVVAWILSMLGLAAATIGTWIMVAPDDGNISVSLGVVDGTWAASDLTETWGPWLLIGGGLAAALGMAVSAIRDWQQDAGRWLVAAETVLALVGIAAIVAGIIILV
jgi:hypothetical protein